MYDLREMVRLGLIRKGQREKLNLFRPLALITAAWNDDGDDDGDADDGDEDEDADEDDSDEDDSDDGGSDLTASEKAKLHAEAKKHRLAKKQVAKQLRETQAKLEALEAKDKDENQRLSESEKQWKERAEKAETRLNKLLYKESVRSLAAEHDITDSDYLAYLLREQGIELDEDGDWPDDVEATVKKLVKKHSTLRASGAKGDEEDEDEQSSSKTRMPSAQGGKRKSKGQNGSTLVKKFPALAGKVPSNGS